MSRHESDENDHDLTRLIEAVESKTHDGVALRFDVPALESEFSCEHGSDHGVAVVNLSGLHGEMKRAVIEPGLIQVSLQRGRPLGRLYAKRNPPRRLRFAKNTPESSASAAMANRMSQWGDWFYSGRLENSMRVSMLIAVVALISSAPIRSQINVQGWHEDGQTWLVWDDNAPPGTSYRIYASPVDFLTTGDISLGMEVGHLIPPDWQANRLKLVAPGATFTIPDGAGASLTLAATQALFVFTPHSATPAYFAVVQDGNTAVTAANSVGPITQTLVAVQCHLQLTTTVSGHSVRVYSHWVDGRADHLDARPDYPVMGNAGFNGTPHIFAVSEPLSGPTGQSAPAVVALHGSGGAFQGFLPGGKPNIGLSFQDAILITLDGILSTASGTITNSWFGYPETFDRLLPVIPYPVPDGTLIVNYTQRRVDWELDWILANAPVDPERLSLLGHSGGSRGGGAIARLFAHRFSAYAGYSVHLEGPLTSPLFGDRIQNLPTSLPGAPGATDVFIDTTRLSPTERDLPFSRMVIGRADVSGIAAWNLQQIEAYEAINDAALGHHLFWDERPHGIDSWTGAHFNGATALKAETLTRYRLSESYPAFFNDDHDAVTPGRQPQMGDGDPMVGDVFGTWSGYYDWDRAAITETPASWACTVWLVALSAVPQDNFPGTSAVTDLAIRRPQSFKPLEGTPLDWRVVRVSDGSLLQHGTATVGADDLVQIHGLEVFPDPDRILIEITVCNPGVSYAGSGEDFDLFTRINDGFSACHVKTARAGDHLTMLIDSPLGGFDLFPPLLVGQFFVTGTAAPSTFGFPELHLDPGLVPGPFLILNGVSAPFGPLTLPPDGIALGPYVVVPGLAGLSVMIQGLSLAPTSLNGIFATTAGHVVQFVP